jgi:hypothetical protein
MAKGSASLLGIHVNRHDLHILGARRLYCGPTNLMIRSKVKNSAAATAVGLEIEKVSQSFE